MPDLLIAWVAFPAVQLVLWVGCGSLVTRFLPGDVPRTLLAPLGFCVVVVAGGFVIAVPALAELTTPIVALLAVAGLALGRPWAARRPSPWLIAALAVLFAVYAAPIVLSGSATFAGYIKLDDTATWLALTDRVMETGRSLDGLAPSSYEATLAFNLADGYPIGVFIPLGVGSALTGMDTAWLIQPYMALLALLLALALWDLSGRLLTSCRARAVVVVFAAQPALLYGFYLWGGIKELAAAALIALVACLASHAARAGSRTEGLASLALAIAALVGCLSVAGAVWVGPLLLGALAVALTASSVAGAATRAGALLVLVALLIAPVLLGGALLPPTSSPLDDPDARGNLIEPLSALQALGIWPAGDFRVDPVKKSVTIAICAIAAVAAIGGCAAALRKRHWDLVAYFLGVPTAALAITVVGSPWVQGKAFAIVSPVLLFGALLGCVWVWSERRLIVGAGVAALVAGGIVWSNALAYTEVNLAPRDQLAELEKIGEMVAGEGPVLMTEYQPYGVRHFLRKADPEGASELRRRLVPLADGSSLAKGLWADTDDFRPDAFEPYEALVLRRSPEQSRPPGHYSLIWAGEFYEVWTRTPDAPVAGGRLALGAGRSPLGEPRCSEVRDLARTVPGGSLVAASLPEPAITQGEAEPALSNPATTGEGELTADFRSRGGSYSIWLHGSVRGEATLRIDDRAVSSVRHVLNNEGLYTDLGALDLTSGIHELTIDFGGSALAPGGGGPGDSAGPIAISPAPPSEPTLETVRASDFRALCGRPSDWIEALP